MEAQKWTRWSKEEIDQLYDEYPKCGANIPKLNRTKGAIFRKAQKLGLKVNPGVHGQKISIANSSRKRKPFSKKWKENMSKVKLGRKLSKETKDKMRISALKRKPIFKNTFIEVALQNRLKKLGITYETHIPICNICQPDIVFLDIKLAIFADGDYWHNLPNYIKRDNQQNKILKENGWIIRRFWEHEIQEDLNRCIDEILYVMELKK